MTDIKDLGDLQIYQNVGFQSREWIAQRVAWVVMALFIFAGLLGLFGGGPLSRQRVTDPSGALTVEYDRLARLEAASELRVEIDRQLIRDGQAHLWIDQKYLDNHVVDMVTPEPSSMATAGDRLILVIDVAEEASPAIVTVHTTTQHPGSLPLRMGAVGGPTLELSQFIYP